VSQAAAPGAGSVPMTAARAAGSGEAHRARRRQSPLWLRLISALLALTALGLALTGVFGVRLLRGYLVDRADDQLRAATSRLTGEPSLPGQEGTGDQILPSDFQAVVQDAEGARIVTFNAPLRGDEGAPDLPALDLLQAAARADEPFTVDSAGGGPSWRVLATPLEGRRATLLVATSLDEVDATVGNLLHIDLVVGAIVLAGLALASYTLVRTAMRPLTEIEETAAAIAAGDLSRRIADQDEGTEVGRLGRALNAMLEQIETAFRAREISETAARRSEEKMRRFVADASHELRTPLTSIRGFAELHRQGAVTDAVDVSRLLARVEAEATRMGLLVDDLLQLARLDQQRPLAHGPVDLVVVAADAVEAARTRAPDRTIRLVVDPTDTPAASTSAVPAATEVADRTGVAQAREPGFPDAGSVGVGVTLAGDEARLRQVLTNLVDNALTHTPDGTPVTVRVGRGLAADLGEVAVVEVRDEGPGLTPDQAERVFERFYRTDAARSRAQGGTGLGLSIVAAITAAHGGRVEVDTAPGAGATFRVLLPRQAPPAGADPARPRPAAALAQGHPAPSPSALSDRSRRPA